MRLQMALDREQEERMRFVDEQRMFERSSGIASIIPEYLAFAGTDPTDQGASRFDRETRSKTRVIIMPSILFRENKRPTNQTKKEI